MHLEAITGSSSSSSSPTRRSKAPRRASSTSSRGCGRTTTSSGSRATDASSLEAIERGDATVDFELPVPVEAGARRRLLITTMEETDAWCERGELLTLASPPEQRGCGAGSSARSSARPRAASRFRGTDFRLRARSRRGRLTPVSSSTLRTCAGGASSVSAPSSPSRLRTAIEHTDTRRVEEVEAAAVEHDPRGTGVDELVERVAQLWLPSPCRSRRAPPRSRRRRTTAIRAPGRPRAAPSRVGRGLPLLRLDTIRRSSRRRGVRRARTARPRRCSASRPPAPGRSGHPAAARRGARGRRTRCRALRVSMSPSV